LMVSALPLLFFFPFSRTKRFSRRFFSLVRKTGGLAFFLMRLSYYFFLFPLFWSPLCLVARQPTFSPSDFEASFPLPLLRDVRQQTNVPSACLLSLFFFLLQSQSFFRLANGGGCVSSFSASPFFFSVRRCLDLAALSFSSS